MRNKVVSRVALGVGVLLSLGASSDTYPGRILAMQAFRQDFGWPGMAMDDGAIRAAYEAACDAKSSNACKYKGWMGEDGGDPAAASAQLASRCPDEPQSCVVIGLAATRDTRGNLRMDSPDAAAGLRAFKQACEKTYAAGCTHLGELYLAGLGTAVDAVAAHKLFAEGCRAEDPYGCYLDATLLEQGRGVAADRAAADKLYAAACRGGVPHACVRQAELQASGDKGDPAASLAVYEATCKDGYAGGCAALGRAWHRGIGTDPDPGRAEELYRKACDDGAMAGCLGLATMYEASEAGGGPQDAQAIYEQACDSGLGSACTRLGKTLSKTKAGKKDPARVTGMFDKACKLGDGEGCDALGVAYETGAGVDTNPARAAELYTRACDTGAGRGCFHLSEAYAAGKGVKADPARASKLLDRACTLGHGTSCSQLAEVYIQGNGVPKDVAKGSAILTRGCDAGDGDNCAQLGQLVLQGELGPADPAKAMTWFERGCDRDSAIACGEAGKVYASQKRYTLASQRLDIACRADVPDACAEYEKVAFPATFGDIVRVAFESRECQVWAANADDPSKSKLAVRVSGDTFTVKQGSRKGTYTPEHTGDELGSEGTVYTGKSGWKVGEGKGAVSVKHVERWDTEEDGPLSDFPGNEAWMRDPVGDQRMVFDREEGTVTRTGDVKKPRCSFYGGLTELSTDGCSEIQALIAGALASECK
jgi:TPR repeat protein